MFFVHTEKFLARRLLVIDDIEDLAVDAPFDAGQNDRLGAIVNICQWNSIGTAQVKKNAEGPYTNPSC